MASACMTSFVADPPKARSREIANQLPLGLLLTQLCPVDVRPIPLIPLDQPLLCHDLQKLERRRIGRRAFAVQHVVDVPHGAWAAVPQDAQDCQLGVGRFRGHSGHVWPRSCGIGLDGSIYELLRSVNEELRRPIRRLPVWELDERTATLVDRWDNRAVCRRGQGDDVQPGTYAKFETSEGPFTVRLFDKEAPSTVANFVGLAEGTKEWLDPNTGERKKAPFYDGVIFHRVINGFMIQGGDRLGQGTGGPGYNFADEFHPKLRHDRAASCRWPTPARIRTAASSSLRWGRPLTSTTATRCSARWSREWMW